MKRLWPIPRRPTSRTEDPGLSGSVAPPAAGIDSEILEHVEDGIMLVEQSSVRWLNAAARRLFEGLGAPAGRPVVEVVRDHRIDALLRRAQQAQIEQAAELEMAGTRGILSVRAVPLTATLTLLLCRDVSRLRYLETVRQQFVANLAHDMRTPLAGLDLAAQTLAGEVSSDKELLSLTSRVLAESQRLQAMLRNLTQLAALDAEGVKADRSQFDVVALVDELVERNSDRGGKRGLQLRFHGGPGEPRRPRELHVIGDRGKTEQALQNVLDNALKFTEQGGVTVTVENHEGKAEISVRDTGPGIPGRDLPRIFERFYKVDRSRGGQPGSGLGLSIARHLVELQGGTITAESVPGSGTTVRIRLPLAP